MQRLGGKFSIPPFAPGGLRGKVVAGFVVVLSFESATKIPLEVFFEIK